jgi:hypothetical protein
LIKLLDEDFNAVKSTVGTLSKYMEDADAQVQLRVCILINHISTRAPEVIEPYLPALTQLINNTVRKSSAGMITSYEFCANVIDVIGNIGSKTPRKVKSAVPSIISCLNFPVYRPESMISGADKLYLSAMRALGKIGMKEPAYLSGAGSAVVKCYIDTFKYARLKVDAEREGSLRWWSEHCIKLILRRNASKIVPLLVKGLQSMDKKVYQEAYKLLVEFATTPQNITILINSLLLSDPNVRSAGCAIVETIGINSPEVVIPSLKNALNSSDKELRKFGAEALSRIGARKAENVLQLVPELISKLRDSEMDVRMYAIEALGTIGEHASDAVAHAIPHLIEALGSADGNVRWCAIQALERIGVKNFDRIKQSIGVLVHLLRDPVSEVRWRATEALQRLNVDAGKFIQAAEKIRRTHSMARDIAREGIDCSEANELIYHARRAIDDIKCDVALDYAVRAENLLFELKREVRPSPYKVEGYLEPDFVLERGYRADVVSPRAPSEEEAQLQPSEVKVDNIETAKSSEELVKEFVEQLMQQQRERELKRKRVEKEDV